MISRSFNVEMDPRIEDSKTKLSDIKYQETLSLQIRDLQSQANRLAVDIADAKKSAEGDMKKPYKELESELVTKEGRYQKPVLIDQLRYLASMLNRADQKPGKDAVDRYEELKEVLQALQTRWRLMRSKA